jgi:hypothetical protein
MEKPKLGRLQRVDLRVAWKSEAGDFTPWLAQPENIAVLGEAIGMDLEVQATEQGVGDFKADILCQDLASQTGVLIENQLEKTDHIHLGQLITYAAGLHVKTIVWVAALIRDEHRAALDWLNEHTSAEFSFFGLEVELWRIDGPTIAPKFNVVCKPNDWSRTITSATSGPGTGELSDAQKLQMEYWTALREYMLKNSRHVTPTKPRPQGFMDFALGRSGIWLTASIRVRAKGITALLVMADQNSTAFYALLEKNRTEFNARFGAELTWRPLPGKKQKHVLIRLEDADPEDRKDWPLQHKWLTENLDRLYETFADAARNLNLEEYENWKHMQVSPDA